MPRRSTSPLMQIINFFVSAPLADVKQALETARAIIAAREGRGTRLGAGGSSASPVTPAAVPSEGDGGVTIARPRRRRGTAARGASVEHARAVPIPAPLGGSPPLPAQTAPGED